MRAMGLKLDGPELKTTYVTEWSIFTQLTLHFVQWPFAFAQKCQKRVLSDKWPLKWSSVTDRLNSRPFDFLQTVHFREVVQFRDRLFNPFRPDSFRTRDDRPLSSSNAMNLRWGPRTSSFTWPSSLSFFDRTLSELENASKNWVRLLN